MAFGVFTNNRTMCAKFILVRHPSYPHFLRYNEAIGYYSEERCSGLPLDISPTGQASESGRDQAHVQLGLVSIQDRIKELSLSELCRLHLGLFQGNMAESCQIASVQGTHDLFGLLSNRLMVGYEYTAKYNLNYSVPYNASFQRCDANLLGGPFQTISTASRGTFRPIYELGYAHYVSTMNLGMPYSQQIVSPPLLIDATCVAEDINSMIDPEGSYGTWRRSQQSSRSFRLGYSQIPTDLSWIVGLLRTPSAFHSTLL